MEGLMAIGAGIVVFVCILWLVEKVQWYRSRR